jgi:exonuclease VII large subunit
MARLEAASGSLSRVHPAAELTRRRSILDRREEALRAMMRSAMTSAQRRIDPSRMTRAMAVASQRSRARLEAARGALAGLDPMSILNRGFSLTYLPGGEVVRTKGQVSAGSSVITRVSDGAFESVVGASKGKPRAQSGRSKRPAKGQMDLFGPPD